MAKPQARSVLYRLIEAGQLTRTALLVPLRERGLEPGDDAILFMLHDRPGATEGDLAAALGLDAAALEQRLVRLTARDLIDRRAIEPALALTERGERIRRVLTTNWSELEEALLGELKQKDRKRLRRTLTRLVALLRL